MSQAEETLEKIESGSAVVGVVGLGYVGLPPKPPNRFKWQLGAPLRPPVGQDGAKGSPRMVTESFLEAQESLKSAQMRPCETQDTPNERPSELKRRWEELLGRILGAFAVDF